MPLAPFADDDRDALRRAKALLEGAGLAVRLSGLVGRPFERALQLLPAPAHALIGRASEAAVRQCLRAALQTLGEAGAPHPQWHQLAVGLTGAAGGAFGLAALAVELPLTTTLMFRSIAEIARAEGEDLGEVEARLECLSVFALGGPTAADDDYDAGYFAVRVALAELVSRPAGEMLARGAGASLSAGLQPFVGRVAQRFSAQVGQQAAAKSIPVLGAVLGAVINTAFMEHFQNLARGHFTVRRLECKYGAAAVEALYRKL